MSQSPFLAIDDNAAVIREAIARAVESVVPAGASFKVTNITVDNGRVRRDHMAIEVRQRQRGPMQRKP